MRKKIPAIKMPKPLSPGEEALAVQLNNERIKYQREYKFHPARKWKFDFTLLGEVKDIAIEIEGGTWTNGAHSRGKHFEGDCEKYAEALILGWRVLRFTTDQVTSGYALHCIKRAINCAGMA